MRSTKQKKKKKRIEANRKVEEREREEETRNNGISRLPERIKQRERYSKRKSLNAVETKNNKNLKETKAAPLKRGEICKNKIRTDGDRSTKNQKKQRNR